MINTRTYAYNIILKSQQNGNMFRIIGNAINIQTAIKYIRKDLREHRDCELKSIKIYPMGEYSNDYSRRNQR